MPDVLRNEKAFKNIKNYDNKCFQKAITEMIFPRGKNGDRDNDELAWNVKKLNWDGIEFPADPAVASKMSETNDPEYALNVYGYDDTEKEKSDKYSIQRVSKKMVGFFDFESILKKILSEVVYGSKSSKSYTQKYQHHIPSGFAMIFKSICDDIFKPDLHQYTAESESVDVTEVFVEMLEAAVKRIWNTVDFDKDFDEETPKEYHTATHCWICKKRKHS